MEGGEKNHGKKQEYTDLVEALHSDDAAPQKERRPQEHVGKQ
jgi:hypothetical protein